MKILSYIFLPFILVLTDPQPANSQIVPSLNSAGDTKHNSIKELLNPETFEAVMSEEYRSEVEKFVNQLSEKGSRYKDQTDYLGYVFYRINSKFLKHYKNFATFEDLSRHKSYDCVTGTALYCWVFDQMGVEYRIMETTFHVYLVIESAKDPIIVESTNPVEGFITGADKISNALETYANDGKPLKGSNKHYYQIAQPVDNQITFEELIGLYYHNMAVEAYNRKSLSAALILQDKALQQYPSPRLKEMMRVMLNTLSTDNSVDPILRQQFLSKYHHLKSSLVTASGER